MMIEIYGAGFKNKGAQLMLRAVLEQFKKNKKHEVKFAAVPKNGEFQNYARLGIYQKVAENIRGVPTDNICRIFLPSRLIKEYGLVSSEDIDFVFDASGLAYSDQMSMTRSKRTAKMYKKYKNAGKPIVMLPQAFGPFNNKKIAQFTRQIVSCADMVFARDKISFEHLTGIVSDADKHKIRIAPDFTTIIGRKYPSNDFPAETKKVAIVPNIRMLDKTDSKTAKVYVNILKKAIGILIDNQYEPFFLIFEGDEDKKLAKRINLKFNSQLNIIKEEDALVAKSILANCHGMIGSRFHALVCTLSQGVPSIALGWSHKYEELMQEYKVEEFCLECNQDTLMSLNRHLDMFLIQEQHESISKTLRKQSQENNELVLAMWQEILETYFESNTLERC